MEGVCEEALSAHHPFFCWVQTIETVGRSTNATEEDRWKEGGAPVSSSQGPARDRAQLPSPLPPGPLTQLRHSVLCLLWLLLAALPLHVILCSLRH
jgi:hypothetical protein